MKLSDISYYVTDRISSSDIPLDEYVTTDSLLPNKGGRAIAESLPPNPCNLIKYQENDILIANIRPYLKKIWKADSSGGASADVLVFRAKNGVSPNFLFAALLDDAFYTHVMKATTGAKMPRGEKNHIMRYSFSDISNENQTKIGCLIYALDRKIALNRKINAELEQMAKELYDYWFVQFDFPNAEGKPYKSSHGKMVYNDQLKRDIPEGWDSMLLEDLCSIVNGATPSTKDETNYFGDVIWVTPKDMSNQKEKFIFKGERNISKKGYDSCNTTLVPPGSVLMTSRAPIGLVSIAGNAVCTNQGFKTFVPHNIDDSYFLYYYINEQMSRIQLLGGGTTFKEVSKDSISKFPILNIGDDKIKNMWINKMASIFKTQSSLQAESERLSSLRDQLLPLLMNGQVKIK